MTLSEEIGLGETQTLEFKRVPNVDRIKYQKTAVAFANGRGGRILFGVANDVEGWGSGFKRVNGQLAEAGVAPVSMQVLNGEVRLNVHRKTEKVPIDGKKVSFDPEKSSIGPEKSSIGNKKLPIEGGELPIERGRLPINRGKVSFDQILADKKLSRPTHEHLQTLYDAVSSHPYFDVQTASKRLAMSARTVRNLLAVARSNGAHNPDGKWYTTDRQLKEEHDSTK